MADKTPVVNYLKDYQVPSFEVQKIDLEFDLKPSATTVINRMQLTRLHSSNTLCLDGENLLLLGVKLNGMDITEDCQQTDEQLVIPTPVELEFELEISTRISPQTNTALEGLYRSSNNYCTQCEAEGFRKITYFFDRPDVLTIFTTKIIADKSENAVLLSNGNLIESGELDDNRHYAVWHDPFKKPCYLFALVAGNLECIKDSYQALDGREIDLRIYVEPKNRDKCDHAMLSLKKSMHWDEQRFGLVYDLDIYMIVAVDDFNMGAMENKGLNVFNSKFVLAKPETATDVDYEGIEAVIAHEYFHNWTGNRVTCRDWFQLTLKEGLTVFRDQEFTADMLSPAVKRIEDVKRLRSNQFPEDAGPMSHPIQPQSYIEMNNFYTMTVYEKGAEVVRLYQTLLGREGFRKGMDLYFKRHDGQAVTVESFRNAMADANEVDLEQMHNWYVQNGTPHVAVETNYDAVSKKLTLNFKQSLPGFKGEFAALLIPIKFALLNAQGQALSFSSSSASVDINGTQGLIRFNAETMQVVLSEVDEQPVISLFQEFSAPVIVDFPQTDAELVHLVKFDRDSFVRWESMQKLAMREIKRNIQAFEAQETLTLSQEFQSAFAGVLLDQQIDYSLKALTLELPDLTYIGEQYERMNVDAVYHVHQWLKKTLGNVFSDSLHELYQSLWKPSHAYVYASDDIANRRLQNTCMQYLCTQAEYWELAENQYYQASNMTDKLAALSALSHTDSDYRESCLQDFYEKWQEDALVLDKWFSLQAGSHHQHALEHVKALVEHADFSFTNPNRVRSVLGVFGRLNLLGFHRENGDGYQFMADQVIKLDQINPQVAARMVAPFTHWKRIDEGRQQKMKFALERILQTEHLSKDVYEIVSKSLAI